MSVFFGSSQLCNLLYDFGQETHLQNGVNNNISFWAAMKVECEYYTKYIVQCHSKCSVKGSYCTLSLYFVFFGVCFHPSSCVTEGNTLEGIRVNFRVIKIPGNP